VSGTAEAGSTVEVYNGAALLGTATADADGRWSLSVTLADGTYSLTATATDTAGNATGTTAAITRTIDTVTPTLTLVTLASNNAVPTLAKAGDVVTLSFRARETLQPPTVTLAGESVSAAFDSATNTWRATHTVAAGDVEGPVAFSIAYRDVAGNAGTAVAATTDASAVTIDLTAPETAITSQPASLSGSASATFAFGSADASASFEASLDGAAYAPATSPVTFTGLGEGAHTFAARAIDAAGNVDATPAAYTWTVDTVVPATPPAPTTPATITSTTRPAVSGTAEAGSTVTIYVDGVAVGTATADGAGRWSYTMADALSEGAHGITITSRDAAGNTSPRSSALTITIDMTAPAALAIASITSTGVSGTAEAGSTVEVFNGSISLGMVTVDASGIWSLTLPLADGTYSLTATSTDAAGNATGTTAAITRTIDTVTPTLTLVTLASNNAVPMLAKAGDVVTLTFKPSEALQTPTVTLAGKFATATYESGTSTWSATHTVAAGDVGGAAIFSIAFSDVAGNAGTPVTATSDSSAVTIDLTAPETTITSQPASLSGSASATFTFNGTGALGKFRRVLSCSQCVKCREIEYIN
jgi:hypothetical protein